MAPPVTETVGILPTILSAPFLERLLTRTYPLLSLSCWGVCVWEMGKESLCPGSNLQLTLPGDPGFLASLLG